MLEYCETDFGIPDPLYLGGYILQQNSPISLIWLQWETAWLAALLLLLAHVCLMRKREISLSMSL